MIAAGVIEKWIHDLCWTMSLMSESEGIEQNLVVEQVVHAKDYMTAVYTKVFEKDSHIGLKKLNNAVYEVHEKWIPIGPQGLDEVEKYANSPSVSGKLNLQTF